jgi:hypothetical protein
MPGRLNGGEQREIDGETGAVADAGDSDPDQELGYGGR